jgi:hypothetical protein
VQAASIAAEHTSSTRFGYTSLEKTSLEKLRLTSSDTYTTTNTTTGVRCRHLADDTRGQVSQGHMEAIDAPDGPLVQGKFIALVDDTETEVQSVPDEETLAPAFNEKSYAT